MEFFIFLALALIFLYLMYMDKKKTTDYNEKLNRIYEIISNDSVDGTIKESDASSEPCRNSGLTEPSLFEGEQHKSLDASRRISTRCRVCATSIKSGSNEKCLSCGCLICNNCGVCSPGCTAGV